MSKNKGTKREKLHDIGGANAQTEPLDAAGKELENGAPIAENAQLTADSVQDSKAPKTAKQPKEKVGIVVEGKEITSKERNVRTVKRWLLMLLGTVMMSSSVYFFQNPNHFTLGGVAGLAIVLSQLITVEFLSYDVILIIINVLLLVVGLIVLGKSCTIKTIICSLIYIGLITLFEHLHVIEHLTGGKPTLTQDPFLELCYAILLFGVGGALLFNSGASSGGTDIIALILKKYTRMNVGVALMLIDALVVGVSFYTFFDFGIHIGLYSVLGLFTKAFLLDGVIESLAKTKYITIITNQPEEIGDYILKVVNHSYTMYDAEGGYTHEKKKVIVTVCKRSEALRIKIKVKTVDPYSFVIITDANEIVGKGFGGTL